MIPQFSTSSSCYFCNRPSFSSFPLSLLIFKCVSVSPRISNTSLFFFDLFGFQSVLGFISSILSLSIYLVLFHFALVWFSSYLYFCIPSDFLWSFSYYLLLILLRTRLFILSVVSSSSPINFLLLVVPLFSISFL